MSGERLAALEVRSEKMEQDIGEIKSDIKEIHGRINTIMSNDLTHMQTAIDNQAHTRAFWMKVLGGAFSAGGVGTMIVMYLLSLAG